MPGTLSNIVNGIRKAFGSYIARYWEGSSADSPTVSHAEAWAFIEGVMARRHFTHEAQAWLRRNINLRVDDLSSTRGGGYWMPSLRQVRLFTAQDEAAVHELAHAWWHDRRNGHEDEMIEATVRLSAETRSEYAAMAALAHGYAHGIPEQGWEGLLVTRNDWEMFAGLASGSMGDMSLLPPYVRKLYEGLFKQGSGIRDQESVAKS